MSQFRAKKIVEIVLKGRKNNATNGEILDKLVQRGIEPLNAPSLLEAVDNGYKTGACSLATPENMGADSTPEAESVFSVAVGRGKVARHGPNPLYLFAKFALAWILATIALAIAWRLVFTIS